jgi:hypothetical protein
MYDSRCQSSQPQLALAPMHLTQQRVFEKSIIFYSFLCVWRVPAAAGIYVMRRVCICIVCFVVTQQMPTRCGACAAVLARHTAAHCQQSDSAAPSALQKSARQGCC